MLPDSQTLALGWQVDCTQHGTHYQQPHSADSSWDSCGEEGQQGRHKAQPFAEGLNVAQAAVAAIASPEGASDTDADHLAFSSRSCEWLAVDAASIVAALLGVACCSLGGVECLHTVLCLFISLSLVIAEPAGITAGTHPHCCPLLLWCRRPAPTTVRLDSGPGAADAGSHCVNDPQHPAHKGSCVCHTLLQFACVQCCCNLIASQLLHKMGCMCSSFQDFNDRHSIKSVKRRRQASQLQHLKQPGLVRTPIDNGVLCNSRGRLICRSQQL
jgi:hypothetical protein